jgi:hypothetical protein
MADTETKTNDEQKPRRRLNVTLDSYTMFAKPRVRTDKKQLRLTFGCSNGYPNVNVETDEEGEPSLENGFLRVSSRLSSVNFNTLVALVKMATKQEPGWKQKIECYHTWKDGRQHDEPQHINDLIVGVDNQGLIFISISQAGRTTTKFVFGPTDWHAYKKEDGSPWEQKELNHFCAISHVEGLLIAMNTMVAIDTMDGATQRAGLPSPSMKPQGDNGGNGGGYRKWDNNGGGGQGGGFQKKPWQGNQNGGGNGGYQKKPWQGNNGGGGGYNNNGQGGYQKKQWNNNGGGQGGNGGYQKKPWDNNGGGGNGGYQKKEWNNNRDQGGGGGSFKKEANTEIDLDNFDDL